MLVYAVHVWLGLPAFLPFSWSPLPLAFPFGIISCFTELFGFLHCGQHCLNLSGDVFSLLPEGYLLYRMYNSRFTITFPQQFRYFILPYSAFFGGIFCFRHFLDLVFIWGVLQFHYVMFNCGFLFFPAGDLFCFNNLKIQDFHQF